MKEVIEFEKFTLDLTPFTPTLQSCGKLFTPFKKEIARKWALKYQKQLGENGFLKGEEIEKELERRVEIFLQGLISGNWEEHYKKIASLAREYVERGFSFEELVIILHLLEESFYPYLFEAYPEKGKVISVTFAVDILLHNEVSIMSSVYFYTMRNMLKEQNEALKRLDRLKDDLTHMVVHDMKSPLTVILTALSMWKDAKLPPEVKNQLAQNMESAARNLEQMVGNLLGITRLEEGSVPLSIEKFDFGLLLQEVVKEQEIFWKKKNLEINYKGREKSVINGDKKLLKRVLSNLLNNAIKFTPPGKKISWEWGEENNHFFFKIRDEGRGIPPEEISRLFEKFRTIGKDEEGGIEGTGLGLPFCKMVVEAHGGEVRVRSEVGKGTEFKIILPQDKL